MLGFILPLPTLLLIAAFLIYLLVMRRLSAFSFAIGGLLLLEIVHQALRHYLFTLFSSEWLKLWGAYTWYLSFAFTDFLYIYLVYEGTRRLGMMVDKATKIILSIIGLLGLIQVLRLLDRAMFDSPLMALIYKEGVPMLNLTIACLALFVAIVNFFSSRNGST